MRYVLRYETGPDVDLPRLRELFEEHRARWAVCLEAGTLLAIGPFEDPRDGALSVFTTREAAEEFARGDPFVLAGLVTSWSVTGWREALLGPA